MLPLGLGLGLGFSGFRGTPPPPPSGGPWFDLFQRAGPGLVPITDAGDPPSSKSLPLGNWYQHEGAPLINVDSALGSIRFPSDNETALLSIGGFDAAFELTIGFKFTGAASPPTPSGNFFILDFAAGRGILFQLIQNITGDVVVLLFELTSITPVDGFLLAGHIYANDGTDRVVKAAFRDATNEAAFKLDSNATIVAPTTLSCNFNLFAMELGDLSESGAYLHDAAMTDAPTII